MYQCIIIVLNAAFLLLLARTCTSSEPHNCNEVPEEVIKDLDVKLNTLENHQPWSRALDDPGVYLSEPNTSSSLHYDPILSSEETLMSSEEIQATLDHFGLGNNEDQANHRSDKEGEIFHTAINEPVIPIEDVQMRLYRILRKQYNVRQTNLKDSLVRLCKNHDFKGMSYDQAVQRLGFLWATSRSDTEDKKRYRNDNKIRRHYRDWVQEI